MAQLSQKEILESLLNDIGHIKGHMPNGELKAMIEDMKEIKGDVSELKHTLLNPEDGVIVKTNQNTWWREQVQKKVDLYDEKVQEFNQLKTWQQGVTRALWIIFGVLVTIIVRILMMHSDQI